MFKDTELYKHAERELDLLLEDERERRKNKTIEELEAECEKFGGKTPQEFINDEVLRLVADINPVMHSVKSVDYVLDMVRRLAHLENLLPLTLEDDEFEKILDEPNGNSVYQNVRNIKVFKSTEKGIYHLDGKAALDLSSGKFFEEPVEEPKEEQMSIFDFIEEPKEG